MFTRIKRMKHRIDSMAEQAQKDLDKQKEADKKRKHAAAITRCSVCYSEDVTYIDNDRKEFSIGKAVAGGILTGGIGTLAGFAGKKGADIYHCNHCHQNFTKNRTRSNLKR